MLQGRDLLSLADLTADEVRYVLDVAVEQKAAWASGAREPFFGGGGLSAALVFLKPSVRTRVSFEVACTRLGVAPVVLGPGDAFSRSETVHDTTKVLERYCDAVVVRAFEHSMVEEIADVAGVPVVNALTDDFHPCQALADLLTIREHKGDPSGVTLAYVGDGNNVSASLMLAGARTGMTVRVATPSGHGNDRAVVALAAKLGKETGATIEVGTDRRAAVEGADVVYGDTWTSMGQEEGRARKLADFEGWQIDEEMMRLAGRDSLFMHCLPAHRGEEVCDGVMDAPYSIVFDQAENRLHAQKALLSVVMG